VIVQRLSPKIQEELKKGFLHQQNQRFSLGINYYYYYYTFGGAEELQVALLVK
jgi:hypothetical protein